MAKKITIDTESDDFKKLLALQKDHNAATAAMDALQAQLNAAHLDWLKQIVDQAVAIEGARVRIEADAEVLCRKHEGDWFKDRQSVKTPLGAAAFRRSTSLEVPSEELTMVLVDRHNGRKVVGDENQTFVSDDYIRTVKSLNLEALGTLPDTMLSVLKITRVDTETFTLKPASVDLGKVVKENAEERKAA